ncbi:hypothetical protein MNEG_8057 [Monoraphidium neglectum]|uniref:GYF domain-containing protein n=1 Tax=Monoraphidium neglectum TaxID=145388 RepID=A0A0D2MGR9_9CHLO|nr:hypothetical protein MNEG_8057 [Monoraphidium neglectum]KIY99906.1 hypothetical protein MNEG_8057 [Monoraphidium neglectum]|eukprot:XP_013898926.1 hypothetical protein MNEG_8057 [Monoraphidium neglectum]
METSGSTFEVALFTAGLPTQDEWPTWYYRDLAGALQGPFEVGAMVKWFQDGALPGDLLVCGVSCLDRGARPAGFGGFRPLKALLADAQAGRNYVPVRASGNGGAAAALRGGLGAGGAQQRGHLDQGGSDVQGALQYALPQHFAVQQQLSQFQAFSQFTPQQQQQQQAFAQQLGQQQLQPQAAHGGRGARPGVPAQQQGRQVGGLQFDTPLPTDPRGTKAPAPQAPPRAPPAAGPSPPLPADAAPAGAGGPEPGSEEWVAIVGRLVGGGDLKWRAILPSGDRVGPFSVAQMTAWLLQGEPPKSMKAPAKGGGGSRHGSGDMRPDPDELLVCGLLSSDYNAQRLPGLKFYKPLSALVALLAGGAQYEPVNKHDVTRGYPKPGAAHAAPAPRRLAGSQLARRAHL